MFCFKEMDTVSSTKDNTVISTQVKTNVAPILQPFTSTEEKSAPFFDVSSNYIFGKYFTFIYNVILHWLIIHFC